MEIRNKRKSANSSELTVLVIGASGNFGGRLVHMLAREAGIRVIPSARREAPLKDLAESLGLDEILTIDRDTLDAATLHTHDVDVVVDASGPFQLQHPKVVQEAINAGVHYLDLADGREFVAGINRFDQAARQANVAVISGASSTPALSHAVIDSLCSGWSQIDSLQANICPSNRQTVGLAVVRAILSTVGQPVRVFENGSWTSSYGWSDTRRLHIKGAGLRFVSLVETPDLDLFVSRFKPTRSARFEAGLGLAFEHLALSGIGKLVRFGLLPSALPLAGILHKIGNQLNGFGADIGFMHVRAEGLDSDGKLAKASWYLEAKGDSGPNVPVLAALALIRRMRDRRLNFIGASACVGLLSLEEFSDDLHRLGIQTETNPHCD